MNITKRMLRFGVAALAMAIGSQALAALPLAESFEGQANGTLATNLPGWSTTDNNLSVVTTNVYDYRATTRPLTNSVTPTNVLQLVEGGMLSFTNGAPDAFSTAAGVLYVDAMVRFVLSDSDPTESSIPSDTKIAIFANSSSNLVIRHGVSTELPLAATNSEINTVALLGAPIDPAAWYRLTVRMSYDNEYGFALAQVRVNSIIVTNTATPEGLFLPVNNGSYLLTAVSFQGSGFIDDVVVTRDVPTFGATGPVFSYVIAEYIDAAGPTYIPVSTTNASYAASGWSKGYSNAWFTTRINTNDIFGLSADGVTVTSPPPWQVTITTNVLNVLMDRAKGTNDLPEQFAGMSSNDIAWIRSFGREPSDIIYTNANSLAFEQAMKLSPYAQETVTAQITSFTVGTSNSTIVVKALTNGVAYASASGLTVNILIDSKASLTDTWPPAAGITNVVNSFNVLGEATNTFNTPIGTFFRARILPQ